MEKAHQVPKAKKKNPLQDKSMWKLNTRYVLSVKASSKDTDKTKYIILRTGRLESDITVAFLLRRQWCDITKIMGKNYLQTKIL